MQLLTQQQSERLTGLGGWATEVMDALGEVGVGLLVALESLFPPVPSEVVLPLAGVLAQQGRMSLPLVVVAATLGSVLGALVLYEAGVRLGRARVARLVDRLPLLDEADLEDAEGWFRRYGHASVLLGRCVPGVRSFVSIPAGVERMPRPTFLVLTALGSAAWNTAFVLAGHALAGQVDDLAVLSRAVDTVLLVLLGVAALLVARRLLRRRARRQGAT